MSKKKKKILRKPIPAVKAKVVKNQKQGRKVTSQFHKLTAQREAASREGREEAVADADAAIQKLGGVEAYQEASAISTALHSTSKWVVGQLRQRKLSHPPGSGRPGLRVLEIGAINTQLLECKSLNVTAVDLNSRDPRIHTGDFLQMPAPSTKYAAVVCSMVLNCVPDAAQRGIMLRNMRAHLHDGGLAFIVVPRTCLEHSFHLDRSGWLDTLAALGLALDDSRDTNKLCFFVCTASDVDQTALARYQERVAAPPAKGARQSRGADFNILLEAV